jgi:Tol biopolymer transport system component
MTGTPAVRRTEARLPRWRADALALALALAAASLVLPAPACAEPSAPDAARTSPRRFVVDANPFLLGQAVDWLDPRHVVWHDPMSRDEDGDGKTHVYRSTLDGGEKVCLTCGLAGPNQVPVVQPRGRWILFHSWNGHAITIGGAGFGGIGSDVWVMTREGTQRTNLTHTTELHDNFHAYWSPDGRYIVWTALNWNADEGGTGRSDVRVARFDPHGPDGPRLVGEHAVRPANGHWYETQWWAPDGSGFLYTETADTAINPELFFCRLPDPASGVCHPVRLTQDPAWDEQAIFTPDMDRILFMSSRNLPGAHNDWGRVATLLDLPAEYDYVLILSVFSDSFLQPVFQQPTDLYELTLRWNQARTRFKGGALRRLTHSGDDGWVIPEFAWDPGGRRLLWTQNKFPDGVRVDQACLVRQLREAFVGQVSGVTNVFQVLTLLQSGIVNTLRDDAASLVRDPRAFPFQGRGCGGERAPAPGEFAQATRIGRFEP